jgi:hypothetical protein
MRNLILILVLVFFSSISFGQHEKVVIGKVCYTEEINSQITNSEFEPYTYHKRIEFKFESGYQITIKEETKHTLNSILKQYESFHNKSIAGNIESPQLIDNFSPETISKGEKIIDPNKLIKIYYCHKLKEIPNSIGNLIIKIPELKDMFGSETAPEQYIFISGDCLKSLIECLEK